MRAVCPNCQTSYEIEPDKLPAPRIRLRCNRCEYIFPFHLESQSVDSEAEKVPPELPSLIDHTPIETITQTMKGPPPIAEPEGNVVNVEEVSSEFHLPKSFELDDRTERAKIPANFGRWIAIFLVALIIVIGVVKSRRPKRISKPEVLVVTTVTATPTAFPTVSMFSPTPEISPTTIEEQKEVERAHEVIRLLEQAKETPTPALEKPKTVAVTIPSARKADLSPYQADYAAFSPTSWERLRKKLEAPMKEPNPDDELMLMTSEVHSYLGKRTDQKTWISYGYETAFRYRNRHPEDARGKRALAMAYATARQYSKAAPLAQEALSLLPESQIAHYVMGISNRADEGKAEGIRLLEDSHAKFPQSFPIAEALAAGYVAKEDYANARRLSRDLLDREPGDLYVKAVLAGAYEGTGKWLETAGLLEDVVKGIPKWNYRVSLARAYRKTSRAAEARKILDQVLQNERTKLSQADLALVTLERGKIEFEQGKYGESLVYLTEANRLNLGDGPTMQFLAGALFREKRYKEAATIYTQAAKASPNDLSVKRYLGMSLLEAGDFDGAERALSEVVRGGEEDASLYYHLARVREAKGDRSGAIAYLERALQKDPSYSNAKIRLDKLLKK